LGGGQAATVCAIADAKQLVVAWEAPTPQSCAEAIRSGTAGSNFAVATALSVRESFFKAPRVLTVRLSTPGGDK